MNAGPDLPGGSSGTGSIQLRESDPAAVREAFEMDDSTIPQKPLSHNGSGSVDGVSSQELHERAKETLTRLGFTLAEESAPEFNDRHPLGTANKPAYGYVVGEAGIRPSPEGLRVDRRRAGAAMAVGGVLLVVAVAVLASGLIHVAYVLVLLLPILLLGTGLAFWITQGGEFDSQVVTVAYWGTAGPLSGTAPPTSQTPLAFDLRVHAGEITTVNLSGGKGLSASRQFRAVVAGGTELERAPAALLAGLGSARPG